MAKAIKGLALNNSIRVIGINSTTLVQEVTSMHQTTPCASAALGRTLSITALMGVMKNDERISITIDGNGPLGRIHTQYLQDYKVRGYVDNPNVQVCINDQNKLDVKKVVGSEGSINVVIHQDLKNDYYGSVPLVSGEISEDFTYYFAASEQIPSLVSAGVLVDTDGSIKSSGAIIIQVLPQATDDEIEYIESSIDKLSNISDKLLSRSVEEIIRDIFTDFTILDTHEIEVSCTCSREDLYAKVNTLPVKDLEEIKEEDKQIEAVCPWCNSKYIFDENDIDNLISEKTKLVN